jgi:hypothetical protein
MLLGSVLARSAVIAGALLVVPAPAIANAEQAPPTSVVTTLVERQVPVTSIVQLERKDDDSGNAGLFGRFGLLGLAGLAGLIGRRRGVEDRCPPPAPAAAAAPKTAEGASTSDHP